MTEKERLSIDNIFTETYYKLVQLSKEYVLYLIIDILKKSGIYSLIKSGFISVEDIVRDLQFISKAGRPISWMLSYIKDYSYLEMKKSGDSLYYKISRDLPVIDHHKIIRKMMKLDRNVQPSNLLLEKAAKGYPDFFKGNKSAVDILFTEDRMKLWNEYFNNNNSGYVVYNAIATLGLLKWLPRKHNIRILEIGGGMGSAAVFFLKEIHNQGLINKIKEYVFSDVSPILLRAGNKLIMEELPDDHIVELKALDFNKSFLSQGIKPSRLDLVYGVNTLHAAENIIRSLGNIYDSLTRGGKIILSECVRSRREGLLFQELIFNFLDNYADTKLSEVRPMPGFLDVESWERIFNETKFKNIEIITNVDTDGNKSCNVGDNVFAMIIKGEK
jgi:SAM-dependent methyltransferase